MLQKYPVNACGVRDGLSGDMLASCQCNLVDIYDEAATLRVICCLYLQSCLFNFVICYLLFCFLSGNVFLDFIHKLFGYCGNRVLCFCGILLIDLRTIETCNIFT